MRVERDVERPLRLRSRSTLHKRLRMTVRRMETNTEIRIMAAHPAAPPRGRTWMRLRLVMTWAVACQYAYRSDRRSMSSFGAAAGLRQAPADHVADRQQRDEEPRAYAWTLTSPFGSKPGGVRASRTQADCPIKRTAKPEKS